MLFGIGAGIVAVAALVVGSEFGGFHTSALHPKVVDWICAAVVLTFGLFAVGRISRGVGDVVSIRVSAGAGGAVRLLSRAVGYLIVGCAVLGVLNVSIEHLLVGVGLAGIVLGLAAQPSLGNVFAGLVLLFSKPFGVGDHIRVRSGALGGIFDAWVRDVSLTYVTLQTDDGLLKVPNSAMLAAGVAQLGATPPPTPPRASSATVQPQPSSDDDPT
jgi:small-conductance mechanosensitive channel